jgi:tetratricopeptide (TPR) repeat protein
MIEIDVPIWAARLRVLRQGQLWSRRALSRRLADTAGDESRDRLPPSETLTETLQLWEAGVQRPDERYTELLCRAFDVDETELFVGGHVAGTTLWHYLTGVPLLPGMFVEEEEERTGRAIEAPHRADDETVRYFKALVAAYTRADLRPADLANVLRRVFAGIDEFRRDADPSVRQAFLMLAAENAELISRMNHEAGDVDGALAWSDEAIGDAREAADALLEAHALAQRGGLSDATIPPGQLIALAAAARERTDLPPRMDALARQHEAQGHALAGDLDMCRRRLEESAEALAEPGEETPYAIDCSQQAHNALCAACLVHLGQATAAIGMLEKEPPKAVSTFDRALALAHMAHAYADTHERERLVETAGQALALARRTGARRALRELAKVHIPPQRAQSRRILV